MNSGKLFDINITEDGYGKLIIWADAGHTEDIESVEGISGVTYSSPTKYHVWVDPRYSLEILKLNIVYAIGKAQLGNDFSITECRRTNG